MRQEKLEKLEANGWSIGDADDFLDDIQSLKLKVGKHYRNRKGDIVLIIKKCDGPNLFPFISKCGKGFTGDGSFIINGEHSLDLIEELEPLDEIQTLKLKVGKHYRNRKGDIVLIIKKYDEAIPYPFVSKCCSGFSEDGSFISSGEHNLDLIEELGPLDELTYMLSEYHHRKISERDFRGFVAEFLNAEG